MQITLTPEQAEILRSLLTHQSAILTDMASRIGHGTDFGNRLLDESNELLNIRCQLNSNELISR